MATRSPRKTTGKSNSRNRPAPRSTSEKRGGQSSPASRWSAEEANAWYEKHPWLVGCNYNPASAINQLEMWQKETFDPRTIVREMKLAQSLGFTSVRVFLHNLVFEHDRPGFFKRLDQVLDILQAHGVGAMLVFFDSVWHPFPHPGPQPRPEPGVHNSGWVQAPGLQYLLDPVRFDRLESYVCETVGRHAKDPRVQVWDLWNEPDNGNGMSYGPRDLGAGKGALIMPLLQKAFAWARAARPRQPLTSGIWLGDWATDSTMKEYERLQVELSDVVSFHNYSPADDMERRIQQLSRFGRPLLCTEYMARGPGSTFETVLPVLKQYRVGAYSWGFVQGKTQTHLPWDSWQRPYVDHAADPWFHEIFRSDGKPYREEEAKIIRQLTGAAQAKPSKKSTMRWKR